MQNILELKKTCLAGMSQEEIKAYLKDNGYEWKDWYFDIVYTPGRIVDNIQFWKVSSEYVSNIRPDEVIGHNHGSISDDYDWITLLSCLERWNNDIDADAITNMLKEQENLPTGSLIHLEKYGNFYFFCEGRHRMVQAKFLEVEKVRCLVSEYIFDEHAYNLFCRIQSKANILKEDNWRPDLPVNATVEGIQFVIPLEDKAVEVLEQSIMNAHRIARIPLYRRYYTLRKGDGDNPYQCFNLKFPQSTEKIVSALVNRMRKTGKR